VAAKVFGILSENHVNILMISQSSSEANISFIVSRESLDKAVNTLELTLLGGDVVMDISSETNVCVVAVVGAGMKGIPGVAARVFKAVADEEVNVRMIAQGSSELNISFVVQEEDGVKTIRALHREFRLDKSDTQ
jgi:aspartate kinase